MILLVIPYINGHESVFLIVENPGSPIYTKSPNPLVWYGQVDIKFMLEIERKKAHIKHPQYR